MRYHFQKDINIILARQKSTAHRQLFKLFWSIGENANMIPEKSFTGFAPLPGFINPKTHKTWMNYHWYLFRAKGKSARVIITDWKGDAEPAGPVGQQLMFNYLQVHPYYPQDK